MWLDSQGTTVSSPDRQDNRLPKRKATNEHLLGLYSDRLARRTWARHPKHLLVLMPTETLKIDVSINIYPCGL